jgi:hypothetical protein
MWHRSGIFAETPEDATFRYTRILGVEHEIVIFAPSETCGRLKEILEGSKDLKPSDESS